MPRGQYAALVSAGIDILLRPAELCFSSPSLQIDPNDVDQQKQVMHRTWHWAQLVVGGGSSGCTRNLGWQNLVPEKFGTNSYLPLDIWYNIHRPWHYNFLLGTPTGAYTRKYQPAH